MKKILATMTVLALAIAVQGQTETVDTAQYVVVYDYECRTQDDEGTPITDKMQIVVQVGQSITKSMPRSNYRTNDERTGADIASDYQEAYMHMPTIWTGWPSGKTTVREFIYPREFEGYESTPDIKWSLLDDTVTVNGYHCQQATATFRGVEWRVCYTEEIPSSAGPWRLRGLPGLIVKAESDAHTFSIAELRQEASPITAPTQNPEVQRMKYAKLLKYRNEVYGNRQYAKKPTYYIPDLQSTLKEVFVMKVNNQDIIFANGHPLLTKAHVYKPLELK